MIKLSSQATKKAFDAYLRCYATGQDSRGWSVEHQLGLYATANKAFASPGSLDDFSELYGHLKRGWQVFRNAQSYLNEGDSFRKMMALDPSLKSLSLSTVEDKDWPVVCGCVAAMRDIKRNKSCEPSLVAISKFLHFWNPRLFVIFDAEVMEYHAFRQPWLSCELPPESKLTDLCRTDLSAEHRISKYLRVLCFANEFVRENPQIRGGLAAAARGSGAAAVPDDFEAYEAAAVEWCILGLVELPPIADILKTRYSAAAEASK